MRAGWRGKVVSERVCAFCIFSTPDSSGLGESKCVYDQYKFERISHEFNALVEYQKGKWYILGRNMNQFTCSHCISLDCCGRIIWRR